MTEKLLFEKSRPGRRCFQAVRPRVGATRPADLLPERLRRRRPAALPEVSELELVRHFTRLSRRNVAITTSFYPLGSCTMKYNPEAVLREAGRPGHAWLHPLQDEADCQGILAVLHELEGFLGEISGLPQVTLQPAAGAHGELTALLVIRQAILDRGERERKVILIPDSAHGTNPATCTMAGFKTRELKSGQDGQVDLDHLRELAGPETAGVMITNPNTLGIFEQRIGEICRTIHDAGGFVYMDGANLNALLGEARPGDFGVDAMHFNLHKTFSTPHGMGGPGAGPIAVVDALAPFLPVPRIVAGEGGLRLDYDRPRSIGSVRGFYGNTAVLAMAWTYILLNGREGLRRIAHNAVLNANYLLGQVKAFLPVPHGEACLHEFVATARPLVQETGVNAMDVAKALLDKGFHPPTTYFPLIVPEALMVEPTETECREVLDGFARALQEILEEARRNPEAVKQAPTSTCVSRPDEVQAVKNPILRWEGKQ